MSQPRDKKARCSNCQSFQRDEEYGNPEKKGQCRLEAPVVLVLNSGHSDHHQTVWPEVDGSDWCRKHQAVRAKRYVGVK